MNHKRLVTVMLLNCLVFQLFGAEQVNTLPYTGNGKPLVSFEFEGNTDNGTGLDISASIIDKAGYSKGLDGKALSLKSGTSLTYLTIDSSKLPFSKDQDFSVQYWVKTTMDSDKPFVMLAQKDYKDNSLASQHKAGWVLYSYGGTWAWTMGSDGRRITHENENGQHMPLNDGKWHQLTMTYDSTNAVIRLYYDGDNKALYKVRDTRGFDFTSDKPLVVGWNGDNGADTQKPVLQAINDGAGLLQNLVDEFNSIGLEELKTEELVDLIVGAERLVNKKIDIKTNELPEPDRDKFREEMKAVDLKPVEALVSKLRSNPYTIYQNRNLTAISAVAKLYIIEDNKVIVRADVANEYTKKTRLHPPVFEMDSLKIWDRVLSTNEVLSSYAMHFRPDIIQFQKNKSSLTAACWNIWHGGKHFNVKEHGWDSRLKIAEMLKEENADVVMMQETYSSGDFIAAELGYYFAASVDWDYLNQGANLSVISRYPIQDMYVPETSSFMDCGVKVSLSKTQDMYVMSNWYGMNEFNNVFEYHKPRYAESDTIPMLFAGDFNAVPHTDGGRSPASKALLDAGFTDAYRSLYPDVEKHKGPTHRSGSRIDQIYYKGAGLKNTSTKVISTAEPGFPSDHYLIVSKFDLDYKTEKNQPSTKAYNTCSQATVLLITSDSLAQAWKPFAQWKTSIGKATKIVTIEEIEKQYNGRDIQEKIRACCLDHINNSGTKWVILGGDSQPNGKGIVPDRDTKHSNPPPTVTDIPTDIYYISEKDWDANDDGVYGDWKKDKDAISYTNSKACIGRIPLRTAADVAAYTEKVIAYESNYPSSNFACKMVYTCPEKSAYPKLGTSKETLENIWADGHIDQFFGTHTPWDKDEKGDYDLSTENWGNMIDNKVAGKLHMHGHGLLDLWILENGQKIKASNVDALSNKNAYLAMTTVSCYTGYYDAKKDPCITESMIRKPNGGAVMIVAPSRPGVPVFHNPREDMKLMITQGKMDATTQTMTRFWKYSLYDQMTAGQAFQQAKADMTADADKNAAFHYIQCELNLLGDPTVDLRAKDPVTPKMTTADKIKIGKQIVKIKTDVPYATVCLWKYNEVYEVAKTSQQGIAEISVNCKTAGKLSVAVTGPSLNACVKVINVTL